MEVTETETGFFNGAICGIFDGWVSAMLLILVQVKVARTEFGTELAENVGKENSVPAF